MPAKRAPACFSTAIDSANIAVPGDLNDASVARGYFALRADLGIRGSLTIAHEPRAETERKATATLLGSTI